MKLRGFDVLQQHVPELRTTRGQVLIAAAFVASFGLCSLFFLFVDRVIPEWMPDGEILVLAVGFFLLSRFFSQRRVYKDQFGERAYPRAFMRFNIPGLGMIGASIAHLGYMPGPQIPPLWWTNILIGVGWVFLAAGVTLLARSVLSVGPDSLSMLYVYYPAEGRMTDSSIYGVIRHPLYSAVIDIAFGLSLVHASWYALVVMPILVLFFFAWIRLVEEKELLERLKDYAAYRGRVPAFWPLPPQWLKFFRYLILDK